MSISRRELLAASCAATVASFSPGLRSAVAQAVAGGAKLPIGMNVAGIADWEPGFPFLNLMWGARPWLTRNAGGGGPFNTGKADAIPKDPDGYPLEIPFTVDGTPQEVFTVLPNRLTKGEYVLLHDGQGEFQGGIGTRVLDARPGRVLLSMEHAGEGAYEFLHTLKSMKGDHLRNIRILPVAQEKADLSKNPFRPEFLEFCRPFHALRFMDWQSTNNSVNREWSKRKTPTFYSQGAGSDADPDGFFGPSKQSWLASGVSVEVCLAAANLSGCDAWLCVPHRADDDYIRQMAMLTREKLAPGLKVYVEFSNEIWNWQFRQAHWMLRSRLAAEGVVAAGGNNPWKDRTTPPAEAFRNDVAVKADGVDHPERTGALFRRCFKIWEDVFAGDDRKRLVRVAGVQGGWPDTAIRTLNFCLKNGGVDAVSPAGYFGPDDEVYKRWEAAGAALTAEQVVNDMLAQIPKEVANCRRIAEHAKKNNVAYVAYEGGQHIQPKGQAELPYNKALGEAQKHPKLYDAYMENFRRHVTELDCKLFMAFSSVGRQGTRWGSWGHLERYGQDPAEMPKFRALLDANTPRA